MEINRFPGRIFETGGQQYLYFGGTAYLGLATHPRFQENVIKALRKWGTFYGSSRNANVKLAIYNDFEDYFADFIGVEATLTVSSGTLSGKLTIDFLEESGKPCYHYPKSHPAIVANRDRAIIKDGQLHPDLRNNSNDSISITADSIESGTINITDFELLSKVGKHKHITLLLDESHSIGIVGDDGRGQAKTLHLPMVDNKIVVASMSKALGIGGGVIAGNRDFINALKTRSTFVSASPANAAYLDAFMRSEDIYLAQREKLFENLSYFKQHFEVGSIPFNAAYPVLYFYDDVIYEALAKADIRISRFRYPTYKKMMNRIVITADHTRKDLDKLLEVLNRFS